MTVIKSLQPTIDALQQGKVVVFPTETVYGLGADPFDENAIERIYKIKGRDFNKPLPLIANSLKSVKKYFELSKIEKELADKYWPGPLTLVLNLKKDKSARVLKKLNKVSEKIAVRVSCDKIACRLASGLKGFIISTSANVSGQPACSSASAVEKQFRNKKDVPDLILDIGQLKSQKPTTIVVVKNEVVNVLRQGEVEI